jgi:hypothetical protein
MPLWHPSEGKVITSDQIEFYQKMNPLAHLEGLEQLPEISRWRVARKHNRIHGHQRRLTTVDRFSNMLSMILKKYNGTTAPGIRPQAISSL